jgi:D-sedoheptulose 7-phosphate isomerase
MAEAEAADLVRKRLEEHIAVSRALLDAKYVAFAVDVAAIVTRALEGQGKVILCGNGGSAADATHLATELMGRFMIDRRPFPAVSLADNSSALTAIANDHDFLDVFARQVHGLGRPGDVLIALSTSGRSENVIAAVNAAREVGLHTIGLTGRFGTPLASAVDRCLCVPSDDTPRVQEAHMLLGHTICELAERALAGRTPPDHP